MSNHAHKHFDKLRVEKLPDSQATIVGELTLEYLSEMRPEALKALGESAKIDGFRQGKVPEDVLVKHLGEMRVLEEVAEMALAREYGRILEEAKLSPVGRPQVAITKLAPGIPLEFKITITLEPEFKLPDYKKIAKGLKGNEEEFSVTEAEIDALLAEIEKHKWKPKLSEGENLRDKAKEDLLNEKRYRAKEKRRLSIIENLVKATDLKLPKLLVEAELDRMLGQFRADVENQGFKWEDYLKSIKKTEEEIRGEWKDKAESRSKAELIMLKIAEAEKLEPTNEELEKETKHILSHHKDADPMRVRVYVYQMIKNQKVLEFLETQ